MAKGKVFLDRIKNRRNELDITQVAIAEAMGIPRATYTLFEIGKYDMDEANLKKLSGVLKINLNDIYIKNFKNTKVLTIINNKGGVSKTSSANAICMSLSEMGHKVLAIDTDAQCNLTISFGIYPLDPKINLYTAFQADDSLLDYIVPTEYKNIDMVISNPELGAVEAELATKLYKEHVFRKMIAPVVDSGKYDFIIIDTNPSLGTWNFNIMVASDYCLIPCSMGKFASIGVGTLKKHIANYQKHNPKLELLGVFKTMYDRREPKIIEETEKDLKVYFDGYILDTYIPIDINVKNAQGELMPTSTYVEKFGKVPKSEKSYKKLCEEILKKMK